MKQFNFEYRNQKALVTELTRIKRYCNRLEGSQAVFQIYTKELDHSKIIEVTDTIEKEMPEAYYYGCLSCGNLLDGELTDFQTMIVCLIFEYDTTKFITAQISCSDPEYDKKLNDLITMCNDNPWIKSVELLTTAKMLDADFLSILNQNLRTDLHCVGGCSSNPVDEQSKDTFVFSKGMGFADDATTFFMLGGEDVHAYTSYVLGYEPLGGVFIPDEVEGSVIHKLNGQPAFDVYKRYLRIEHNEYLFFNVLGFPMIMKKDGIEYLRAPIDVMEDGSLVMSGEVDPKSEIRLSYGNPLIMLRHVDAVGDDLAKIGPEAIRIYSCFTRKMYWGEENVSKETENFSTLAPTTGFFTRGELLRIGQDVSLLNATLVVIGLREGEPVPVEYPSIFEHYETEGRLSYEDRLINFIGEATRELEAANEALAKSSIMDGMTHLYNRTEIQHRIKNAINKHGELALVMMDIDNFKKINDTFGHKEGDIVLQAFSAILRNLTDSDMNYSAGRWGGEEFMLLLEHKDLEAAKAIAEKIRVDFMNTEYDQAGKQSVSLGVTVCTAEDTVDSISTRVDNALYQAKSNGKNRIEIM